MPGIDPRLLKRLQTPQPPEQIAAIEQRLDVIEQAIAQINYSLLMGSLSESQRNILHSINEKGELTKRELKEFLKLSGRTIERSIKLLLERGLIVATEDTPPKFKIRTK